MRRPALLATLLAAIVTWAWAWSVLPEDGVVHHIGTDGPDAYGTRAGLLVPLGLLTLGLVALISWLPAVTARRWPSLLNLPYKDHWLAPERREAYFARLGREMDVMTLATVLLLCVGVVDVTALTLGWDWPVLIIPGLGLYMGFMVWWLFWILRRSRPPAGT